MARYAGGGGGGVARGPLAVTVYLNVYDLHEANTYMHNVGLGAYHTGVEIAGKEYTFAGGAGIFDLPPKQAPGAVFRETIVMGQLTDGPSALARALDILKSDFGPDDYNILTRNCNHFADALCQQLLKKSIPGYLNRLAFIGSYFSCFMPREMTQEAPVTNTAAGEFPSAPRTWTGVGPPQQQQPRYQAFGGEGRSLAAAPPSSSSTVGRGVAVASAAGGGTGGSGSSSAFAESEAERRERIRKVSEQLKATLARLASPDTSSSTAAAAEGTGGMR